MQDAEFLIPDLSIFVIIPKLGRPNLDMEKIETALKLIKDGDTVTKVAKQLGLGRSTLYRELQYFKATD